MKQSEYKSKDVRRAANPRLDVDINEILIPFDKIYKMGNLLDLPVYHLIDVEGDP